MSAALATNPAVVEVLTPSEVERLRGVLPAEVHARLYWWACALQEEFARPVLDAATRREARARIRERLAFVSQARVDILAVLVPNLRIGAQAYRELVEGGSVRLAELACAVLPDKFAAAFVSAIRNASGLQAELEHAFRAVPEMARVQADAALVWRAVEAATLSDALITAAAFGVEGAVPVRSSRVLHWIVDEADLASARHVLAVEALVRDLARQTRR